MKRVIIGNGISAIIIAICFDKLGIDYEIYGSGTFVPPPLLILKNDKYHLFDNIQRKKVKVGYLHDGTIYDIIPTEEVKAEYFKKQNRQVKSSSMSDGLNEFYAIDLKDVYNSFDTSKIIDKKVSLEDFDKDTIIYNTVFPLHNDNCEYLYIVPEINDTGEYSYIYDCNLTSDIKRITPSSTEYIKPVQGSIKVKNYYEEPKIIRKDNVIYISRNASCTQLKIEDIIDYIVEENK